jgi:hypothetical protein
MPKMIPFGGELIRINPSNNHVEFSHNKGVSWIARCSSSGYGVFKDLLEYDGALYACTSKGVYCSSNKGVSWICKCCSDTAKSLEFIQDGGREMLGGTADGHVYFSTNKGVSWIRRK